MKITPIQTTNKQPDFKALKVSPKVLANIGCSKEDLLYKCPSLDLCSRLFNVSIKQSNTMESIIRPVTLATGALAGLITARGKSGKTEDSPHIRYKIDDGTEQPYTNVINLQEQPEQIFKTLETEIDEFMELRLPEVLRWYPEYYKFIKPRVESQENNMNEKEQIDNGNSTQIIDIEEESQVQKNTQKNVQTTTQPTIDHSGNSNQEGVITKSKTPSDYDIKLTLQKKIKEITKLIHRGIWCAADGEQELPMVSVIEDMNWIIKNCPQEMFDVLNMNINGSVLWMQIIQCTMAENDVFSNVINALYNNKPEVLNKSPKELADFFFKEKYSMLQDVYYIPAQYYGRAQHITQLVPVSVFSLYFKKYEILNYFLETTDDLKILKYIHSLCEDADNPSTSVLSILENKIEKIKQNKQSEFNTLLEQTSKTSTDIENPLELFSTKQITDILFSDSVSKTDGEVLNAHPDLILQIADIMPEETEEYKNMIEKLKKYTSINYNVADSFGISFLEKVINSENTMLLDIIKDKNLTYTPELDYAFFNIQDDEFREKVKELNLKFPDIEQAVKISSKEAIRQLKKQFDSPFFTRKQGEYLAELAEKDSNPNFIAYFYARYKKYLPEDTQDMIDYYKNLKS